jgi:hypothetical protein
MRRLCIVSAAAVAATVFCADAAQATALYYSITGSLGSDVISGYGQAQSGQAPNSGPEIITGLTFTISGNDSAYRGYTGTYKSVTASTSVFGSTPGQILSINYSPNSNYVSPIFSSSFPTLPVIGLSIPLTGATTNSYNQGVTIFDTPGSLSYSESVGSTCGGIFQCGAETQGTQFSAAITTSYSPISPPVSPVPIPGALSLFGSAMVGMGAFARLRSKKPA